MKRKNEKWLRVGVMPDAMHVALALALLRVFAFASLCDFGFGFDFTFGHRAAATAIVPNRKRKKEHAKRIKQTKILLRAASDRFCHR